MDREPEVINGKIYIYPKIITREEAEKIWPTQAELDNCKEGE
jgi:hypothetical protein